MDQLVKGKRIDMEKVSVSEPKHLDNGTGAKLVYVNYNGSRFNVQTPWMDMPWNMNCYDEGPYPKYSMELSFRGMDDSEDLASFHDKLNELDEKLIEFGVENSLPWFKKKKVSKETVEALYTKTVKVSKDKETGEPDGKWPSSFRLKLPFRDGKWSCSLSNTDGSAFEINDSESGHKPEDILVKNARVRGIIQCVGLWIANGNYMCQWKLVKAAVEVPHTSSTCNFIPDSDEEGAEDDNGSSNMDLLDDSDKEEADDEKVEEEIVVTKMKLKVPKKKVTN